ncbi:MAG: bifunctional diaminohydroxyphosphoribosylaminopyrimidine deaminase/5-amino-6-(5-phosphoribosylamino)uracil reductase RibD [Candidatus Zapsychrus exili]|nr:bifunctional diaminohydroxyphosphoribosylaminopyrimidine deaminase/5-amino-6-(5-phosphoribosylamino)uracil reductase RibD [Candidatus Zapsychrus exili]
MIKPKDKNCYMQKALKLASLGAFNTSPNPMVGAVIVKNNKVIASGYHKKFGLAHAEAIALKKVGKDASGATLYVTLEPCFHHGKTPPCVDAIIGAQIKEVIIGMKDPNPLTSGKSISKLRRAGIKVEVGILKDECLRLNEAFAKYIKHKMPFVVGKSAQSLNSKITSPRLKQPWITTKKTRDYARALRDNFDAIAVGINTVIKDNPRLTGVKNKSLKKIVIDSSLRISESAKIFVGAKKNCIIATTNKAKIKKIKLLREKGVNVIVSPAKNGKVNLKWLLKELAKLQIMSILIEGGREILSNAIKLSLVDKLNIYVAPKIINDKKALDSAVPVVIPAKAGIYDLGKICKSLNLRNAEIKKIYKDTLIVGYVRKLRNLK